MSIWELYDQAPYVTLLMEGSARNDHAQKIGNVGVDIVKVWFFEAFAHYAVLPLVFGRSVGIRVLY